MDHANNKFAGRISLACVDPGSVCGQKIPVIWHGAGAYHGGFYPQNLVRNTECTFHAQIGIDGCADVSIGTICGRDVTKDLP